MTHIFKGTPEENAKWRLNANKAAAYLKLQPAIPKDPMKLGFVFDDGFIKIEIAAKDITGHTEKELANFLYELGIAAAKAKGLVQ